MHDNFYYNIKVYYEDTDAGGVVYHAQYMAFAERARSAMLNLLGFRNCDMAKQYKIAIAVRHCKTDFYYPARLEDQLTVETRLTWVKGASLGFKQKIIRDVRELVSIEIDLACISPQTLRVCRLPDDLRKTLHHYLDAKLEI